MCNFRHCCVMTRSYKICGMIYVPYKAVFDGNVCADEGRKDECAVGELLVDVNSAVKVNHR